MAEDKEPTKRDLAELLASTKELMEAQAAVIQAQQTQLAEQGKAIEELRAESAQLAAARAEALKTLEAREQSLPGPKGTPKPGVQRMPYSGLVQATESCQHGHLRAAGEVWHIDTDVLWSDDPFKPVVQVGQDRDGNPIVEPNLEAPTPMPFTLRPRTAEALATQAAAPRRAADWH